MATNHTQAAKTAEYPLIPMSEIRNEPRKLAIAWHEAASNWIGDKHKLASDIQNYADWYARQQPNQELEQLRQITQSISETNKQLSKRLLSIQNAIESDLDEFMIFQKIREILYPPQP